MSLEASSKILLIIIVVLVRFPCLKLKILMTTELIGVLFNNMVASHRSLDSIRLFFCFLDAPMSAKLGARGANK